MPTKNFVLQTYFSLQLVQLLLRHGANPLQVNSKGETSLDVAKTDEVSLKLCNQPGDNAAMLQSPATADRRDDVFRLEGRQ